MERMNLGIQSKAHEGGPAGREGSASTSSLSNPPASVNELKDSRDSTAASGTSSTEVPDKISNSLTDLLSPADFLNPEDPGSGFDSACASPVADPVDLSTLDGISLDFPLNCSSSEIAPGSVASTPLAPVASGTSDTSNNLLPPKGVQGQGETPQPLQAKAGVSQEGQISAERLEGQRLPTDSLEPSGSTKSIRSCSLSSGSLTVSTTPDFASSQQKVTTPSPSMSENDLLKVTCVNSSSKFGGKGSPAQQPVGTMNSSNCPEKGNNTSIHQHPQMQQPHALQRHHQSEYRQPHPPHQQLNMAGFQNHASFVGTECLGVSSNPMTQEMASMACNSSLDKRHGCESMKTCNFSGSPVSNPSTASGSLSSTQGTISASLPPSSGPGQVRKAQDEQGLTGMRNNQGASNTYQGFHGGEASQCHLVPTTVTNHHRSTFGFHNQGHSQALPHSNNPYSGVGGYHGSHQYTLPQQHHSGASNDKGDNGKSLTERLLLQQCLMPISVSSEQGPESSHGFPARELCHDFTWYRCKLCNKVDQMPGMTLHASAAHNTSDVMSVAFKLCSQSQQPTTLLENYRFKECHLQTSSVSSESGIGNSYNSNRCSGAYGVGSRDYSYSQSRRNINSPPWCEGAFPSDLEDVTLSPTCRTDMMGGGGDDSGINSFGAHSSSFAYHASKAEEASSSCSLSPSVGDLASLNPQDHFDPDFDVVDEIKFIDCLIQTMPSGSDTDARKTKGSGDNAEVLGSRDSRESDRVTASEARITNLPLTNALSTPKGGLPDDGMRNHCENMVGKENVSSPPYYCGQASSNNGSGFAGVNTLPYHHSPSALQSIPPLLPPPPLTSLVPPQPIIHGYPGQRPSSASCQSQPPLLVRGCYPSQQSQHPLNNLAMSGTSLKTDPSVFGSSQQYHMGHNPHPQQPQHHAGHPHQTLNPQLATSFHPQMKPIQFGSPGGDGVAGSRNMANTLSGMGGGGNGGVVGRGVVTSGGGSSRVGETGGKGSGGSGRKSSSTSTAQFRWRRRKRRSKAQYPEMSRYLVPIDEGDEIQHLGRTLECTLCGLRGKRCHLTLHFKAKHSEVIDLNIAGRSLSGGGAGAGPGGGGGVGGPVPATSAGGSIISIPSSVSAGHLGTLARSGGESKLTLPTMQGASPHVVGHNPGRSKGSIMPVTSMGGGPAPDTFRYFGFGYSEYCNPLPDTKPSASAQKKRKVLVGAGFQVSSGTGHDPVKKSEVPIRGLKGCGDTVSGSRTVDTTKDIGVRAESPNLSNFHSIKDPRPPLPPPSSSKAVMPGVPPDSGSIKPSSSGPSSTTSPPSSTSSSYHNSACITVA